MVIDREMAIRRVFNFAKIVEENNAENLLVIHDKGLTERYLGNWQEHARHSEVYAETR